MKNGITRIEIADAWTGNGAWRLYESQKRQQAANRIYRSIFSDLIDGDKSDRIAKDDFLAGYDYALGIDVLLNFTSGFELTLQEKFLFQNYQTVTVEYHQDWRTGEEGDWFNLRCQYYFVGYDRTKSMEFQDWILLDWPAVTRETISGRIKWTGNRNSRDGARASFKYCQFDQIPAECVVASHYGGYTRVNYVPQEQMLLFPNAR